MMQTPKKLVHWAQDFSAYSLGSPFSDTSSSSSSLSSTSSIQYVNSQLVAHGFTAQPGLAFDGLSNADSDNIVKCLLSMLSQRVVSIQIASCFENFPPTARRANRRTCPGPKSWPPNYAHYLMITTVYYLFNGPLPSSQPTQSGRPTCTSRVSRTSHFRCHF
jgi:hypothetical protein